MAWAGYECFNYHAMLKKRVALGLSDSMTAHRFWLWGIASLATVTTIGLDLAFWLTSGASLASHPIGLHTMSLLGVVGVVSIALAFFPPAAYVALHTQMQEPSKDSA